MFKGPMALPILPLATGGLVLGLGVVALAAGNRGASNC